MFTKLSIKVLNLVLSLAIVFTLLFLMPTKASEDKGVVNWQVYHACNDALNNNDDDVREMSNFVCRILTDMVYEHNFYHQGFIKYFKEEGFQEPLEFAEVYSVTGCDISELEFKNFAELIVTYFNNHEDELEQSFYWSIEDTLKPYCEKIKDRSIEFYLGESDGTRRS